MRTVLIGIDPGGNGAEPLSPDYPPGAGLARLCNLSGDAFRGTFDRVNLHPSMVDQGQNLRAGENLLPILRGRRVVALGRRVARAIDADDGPEMQWSLRPGGYVGATLPHPSGLNRWWNDADNERAAEGFMQSLLNPCIHVEGPDGSGKSTLVPRLAEDLDLDELGTENPPTTWSECLARVSRRVRPGIVCDRSSGLISELVYGPVIRGRCVTDEREIWSVVRSLIHTVIFVYCRPERLAMSMTIREGEDPDHVTAVADRLDELCRRYDEVMNRVSRMGGRVIRYDWTRQTPEEVAACVG